MLCPDPSARLTLAEVLHHPWLPWKANRDGSYDLANDTLESSGPRELEDEFSLDLLSSQPQDSVVEDLPGAQHFIYLIYFICTGPRPFVCVREQRRIRRADRWVLVSTS